MKPRFVLLVCSVLATWLLQAPANAAAPPDPGPVNGGLRLRLAATPRTVAGVAGYDVRLDVLNTTNRAMTLRAGWRHENDKGDAKEYIEASTSIESFPAIAPSSAGVAESDRKSPQPELVLKPREALSIGWHTNGRRLKNKVSDPNAVQNPEFPLPGLYSVHATAKIITGDGTLLLRSNEQLVSVDGSQEAPKHTFGQLWYVDPESKTANLSLGSMHKIQRGDQFRIRAAKFDVWKLTITEVKPEYSVGRLEPVPRIEANATDAKPRFPERLMDATLIRSE